MIIENFRQKAVFSEGDLLGLRLWMQGASLCQSRKIIGLFGTDLVGVVAVVEQFYIVVPQINAESRVFLMGGQPLRGENGLFVDGFGHGVRLVCKRG